jgi:hypothetical protein
VSNTLRDMALAVTTEASFQSAVVAYARANGWLVAHFRPARTARGWRTPVEADGAGFPDLVLVRRGLGGTPGRVVFAELKRRQRRLSAAQLAWVAALDTAPGVEVHIWTPADWPEVEAVLGGIGPGWSPVR